MSALGLFLDVLWVPVVVAALFGGTFLLLFVERFVYARVQHRDGPGRGGRVDPLQVWKDFRKTKLKDSRGGPASLRFRAAAAIWRLLPALFLLILLAGILPETLADTEVPLLLLLPLLAVSLEASFLHAAPDSRERFEWRRRLLLRVMGASVISLGFLVVSMRGGGLSLGAVSRVQDAFPFLALFSSPGLFACGLASFGAIFLFPAEAPVPGGEGLSLNRSMHYTVFFVRKMWVLCLISFWVFMYLGGFGGIVAQVLFPLKVAAAVFLFTLIQGSFPRMRSADAGELTVRWLFRLCFFGIFVEAVWVGVWG